MDDLTTHSQITDFDPEAAHLADLAMPDFENEQPDADDMPRRITFEPTDEDQLDEGGDHGPEQMSREAFRDLFAFSFSVPAMLPNCQDFEPLAVSEAERPAADRGADGLYNILERHFPKALSMSDEMADYAALGSFLVGKVMIVSAVLKERREADRKTVDHGPQAHTEPQQGGADIVVEAVPSGATSGS